MFQHQKIIRRGWEFTEEKRLNDFPTNDCVGRGYSFPEMKE